MDPSHMRSNDDVVARIILAGARALGFSVTKVNSKYVRIEIGNPQLYTRQVGFLFRTYSGEIESVLDQEIREKEQRSRLAAYSAIEQAEQILSGTT